MLVVFHGHASPSESDPFHLQPHPLLVRHVALETDHAAGADHPLPRQPVPGLAQQLHNLPVVQRVARGGRHLGIGCHLAPRDLKNDPAHGGIPRLRGARFQKSPAGGLRVANTLHAG